MIATAASAIIISSVFLSLSFSSPIVREPMNICEGQVAIEF